MRKKEIDMRPVLYVAAAALSALAAYCFAALLVLTSFSDQFHAKFHSFADEMTVLFEEYVTYDEDGSMCLEDDVATINQFDLAIAAGLSAAESAASYAQWVEVLVPRNRWSLQERLQNMQIAADLSSFMMTLSVIEIRLLVEGPLCEAGIPGVQEYEI